MRKFLLYLFLTSIGGLLIYYFLDNVVIFLIYFMSISTMFFTYEFCSLKANYWIQQEQLDSIKKKFSNFRKARVKDLPIDLELATSEQLIGELRKRPQCSYVMLRAKFREDNVELNIEINNIHPQAALSLVEMAQDLMRKKMEEE